jgi:hypothetical protein
MNQSRTETLEALVGVVAAIIGVALVSVAPPDLRPLAIVVLVVVYFLGFLLRGFIRGDRPGDRSSR